MIGWRSIPLMGLPFSSCGKALGTERHALIEPDTVADDGGFADDHSGSVVDEEALADAGAGVDVDPGLGVGEFGDDTRNERHLKFVEFVGDAVARQRQNPGSCY